MNGQGIKLLLFYLNNLKAATGIKENILKSIKLC